MFDALKAQWESIVRAVENKQGEAKVSSANEH
jgi:hypothetical protein